MSGFVRTAIVGAALLMPAMVAAAPVQFACGGALVDRARKIAKADDLKLGLEPTACFGEMALYPGTRKQIVVAAASPQCKTGKLFDVYDRSRAGPWYALFAKPVCGTTISVGPKSPWGDNMIDVDGRHYMDKAGAFVPAK